MRDCRQTDGTRNFGLRMLHDDHHSGSLLGQRWVLKRACLDPPCHHQARMGIGVHVVCGARFFQSCENLGPRHTDIEINGERRLEQAVQMIIHEGPLAIVQAQTFPNAVPKHEAAVVDTHQRLGLGL